MKKVTTNSDTLYIFPLTLKMKVLISILRGLGISSYILASVSLPFIIFFPGEDMLKNYTSLAALFGIGYFLYSYLPSLISAKYFPQDRSSSPPQEKHFLRGLSIIISAFVITGLLIILRFFLGFAPDGVEHLMRDILIIMTVFVGIFWYGLEKM